MHLKDKIFLMGMPGSGKTTIGKKLAKSMNYEFIDLDQFIEKSENCSINDIFRHQGEDYFRNAETKYISEIALKKEKTVISLGGGTPCFNDNMNLLLKSGLCIYIRANEKLLLNRLENAKSQRPLFWGLTKQEIENKLLQLITIRTPFYEKAHITVDASSLQEKKIMELIKNYRHF